MFVQKGRKRILHCFDFVLLALATSRQNTFLKDPKVQSLQTPQLGCAGRRPSDSCRSFCRQSESHRTIWDDAPGEAFRMHQWRMKYLEEFGLHRFGCFTVCTVAKQGSKNLEPFPNAKQSLAKLSKERKIHSSSVKIPHGPFGST